MRKRNVTHVADTIFWWVIYALPVIIFFACTIGYIVGCGAINGTFVNGSLTLTPEDFSQSGIGQSGFGDFSSYFEYDAWADAITDGCVNGVNGVYYFFVDYFPLFDTPIYGAFIEVWDLVLPDASGMFAEIICGIMTWFISAHIIHIFVDFIVFIPRLCHKWLGKATQED